MSIGTRSLLFGYHQFLVHPIVVAWCWWRLYGFPWDPRLWLAFFVHDLGYFGKTDMDGPSGERHPELGASIMGTLFDRGGSTRWRDFCLYHSRFYAAKSGADVSILAYADKMTIAVMPSRLQAAFFLMTGEHKEYMVGANGRTPADGATMIEWIGKMRTVCREFVMNNYKKL